MKTIVFSLAFVLVLLFLIKITYGQESGIAIPASPWEICGDGHCDNISENCVWCSKDCGECPAFEPCSEYKTLLSLQFWSGDSQLYRADEESVPSFMIHLNNLSKVENYIDIRNLGCGLSNVNFYFDCPLSYENHTSMFFKAFPPNITAKAFLALSIPTDTRKYDCQYVISSNQFTVRKNITLWLNDLSCNIPTWEGWTLYTAGNIMKRTNIDVNGLPNEAIKNFNEFIMQNVSKDYFDSHIKLINGRSTSSVTCTDCPITGRIYANYNFTIEGYEVPFTIDASVIWNDYLEKQFENGTLKCASPEVPLNYNFTLFPLIKEYKNLITKENAINLVKSCSGDVLDYSVLLSGEGMMLRAVGENKTAYLNLENGNITQCTENVMRASAGNQNTNNLTEIVKGNGQIFAYVIVIVITISIAVLVVIRKRKQKEKNNSI